mgnify:CR=1 FL=1
MVKQKGMDHYRVAALYEKKQMVIDVIRDIFARVNSEEQSIVYYIPKE